MKPSEVAQVRLSSATDKISQESQVEPQVTKITRKVITTTQPVTQTYITKKVITTTTRPSKPNVIQNTRYNNTSSSTSSKPNTSNYSRPVVQNTSSYNRNVVNNNNNRSSNMNNQVLRNYQRPVNQNNQSIPRLQNSQSYGGNRNQPKRPEVSTSNYKPRVMSPNPSSAKIKTINRGKPIENVQITHIIYSTKPLEFHIIEALNEDNLNSKPIEISQDKRNNLQKSGKIEVTCSCDNINLKKSKPVDLVGKYTHYQHAQGIGMTDKKENINPQFYSSEIKSLDPLIFNKAEPQIQILEFRSDGKNYNTTRTITKIIVKPVVNYSTNRGSNIKSYANTNQLKNNSSAAKRGVASATKTTTSSSTANYRGKSGNDGGIVKETTTQVKMGSRSQFNNQSKPIVTTTVDRKSYNHSNFARK